MLDGSTRDRAKEREGEKDEKRAAKTENEIK